MFPSDDTWEWNGTAWTFRASLIPRPPERISHAMAYDSARGVTVLFGGRDGDNNIIFGDTWEYDGVRWTRVATTGPSPRHDHAMAFDSRRGVTVLYAGFNFPTIFGDTWEWNGQTWTQVASSGPQERSTHAMVYNSSMGMCIVYGGVEGSQGRRTWGWDGVAWSILATQGPPPRGEHAMAFDSARHRTVLFGGQFGVTQFRDTWEFGLYPDCDHTTGAGVLDIFDYLCFGNKFANSATYACNCDTSIGNNICDIFDFLCFQNLFAQCRP